MTPSFKSTRAAFTLLTGVLLLSSCEGDSRPFEESVEVAELGLTTLQVTPPANAQDIIFINTGQTLQVGITGSSATTGTSLVLDASERSFRSSNPAILDVNDNGVVTGGAVADGTVASAEISVMVGGLVSEGLMINVSNAALTAIDSIEGSPTLEACLPDEYFAVGTFADNSRRTLDNAIFDVAEDDQATLIPNNGTVSVNATGGTALSLIAQVGEITQTRDLEVIDSLESLAIFPVSPSLEDDESLQLTATGTFATVDTLAVSRSENITENVEWVITSGTDNASVSNSVGNRGLLSGISDGTAVVQASCGTLAVADANITVNDAVDAGSSELAFNTPGDGETFSISLSSTPFQLEVSRGSEFDEDEKEQDVTYTAAFLGGQIAIDVAQLEDGLVAPLTEGATAVVTATVFGSASEIEATGSITVTVTP